MSEIPADENIRLGGLQRRAWPHSECWDVVGILAGIGFGLARHDGWRYFFHSYLLNYCFVLSLALGALFFVALQHITRAGWSVAVRRLAEYLAAGMPCLLVLFLPILIPVLYKSDLLYPWASPAAVSSDELLRHKAPYLNPDFFAWRAVAYFAVWLFLRGFS